MKKEMDKAFFNSLSQGRTNAFISKICRGDTMLFEQIMGDHLKMKVDDNRFTLVKSFEITIPDDYNVSSRLQDFYKELKSSFDILKPQNAHWNFQKELYPTKTYIVEFFKLNKRDVPSKYCLWFLLSRKSIIKGALSLSIVWYLAKHELDELFKEESKRRPNEHNCPDIVSFNGKFGAFSMNGKDIYVVDKDPDSSIYDKIQYSMLRLSERGNSLFLDFNEDSLDSENQVLLLCIYEK